MTKDASFDASIINNNLNQLVCVDEYSTFMRFFSNTGHICVAACLDFKNTTIFQFASFVGELKTATKENKKKPLISNIFVVSLYVLSFRRLVDLVSLYEVIGLVLFVALSRRTFSHRACAMMAPKLLML